MSNKQLSTTAKVLRTVGIVTAVTVIGIGLYHYFKRQINLAMKYCYKVSSIKVVKVGKDRIIIDLAIKLFNRSKFEVLIRSYEFDVSICNARAVTVKNAYADVIMNAEGISVLPVRLDINPKKSGFDTQKTLDVIAYAVSAPEKFIVSIDGYVSAKINFINIKKMPVSFRTTLADMMKPTAADNSTDVKCEVLLN